MQRRIICYARVSKLDQNPENQFKDLRDRGESIAPGDYEVLTEKESTRRTRPIKERIMRSCRQGDVKAVIVWRLDRLARSLSELALNLEDFKRLGVRFIAIRDGIDLDPKISNPVQELQFHLLGAFAQFERDLIRERTIAGLERARSQGKVLGRPKGSKDKRKRRTSGYYKR